MRKEIVLPPEWRSVPVVCPKCKTPLLARYNPTTPALEALRCPNCHWSQDYVDITRKRNLRLAAARRKFPSSKDRQARFH